MQWGAFFSVLHMHEVVKRMDSREPEERRYAIVALTCAMVDCLAIRSFSAKVDKVAVLKLAQDV